LIQNRRLLWFCLGVVLHFLGSTIVGPVVPLLSQQLGATPGVLGILMGVANTGALLAAVPSGMIIRRFGTRLPVIISCAVVAVCYFLIFLFPRLAVLFVMLTVATMARTMFIVSTQTYVGGLRSTSMVSSNFGWLGTATAVAQVIGPLGIGYLVDTFGVIPTVLVMASTTLLSAGYFVALLRNDEASPTNSTGIEERSSLRDSMSLILSKPILLAVISSSIIIVVITSRRSFYPLLLVEMGFSATIIGLMMSIRGLTSLAIRVLLSVSPKMQKYRFRTMVVCLFVVSVGLGSTFLCRNLPLLVLNSILVGVSFGLGIPLSQTIAFSAALPDQRGLVLGVRVMVNRLAEVVSPLMCGVVAELMGIPATFWVGGLVLAAGSLWALLLARKMWAEE